MSISAVIEPGNRSMGRANDNDTGRARVYGVVGSMAGREKQKGGRGGGAAFYASQRPRGPGVERV